MPDSHGPPAEDHRTRDYLLDDNGEVVEDENGRRVPVNVTCGAWYHDTLPMCAEHEWYYTDMYPQGFASYPGDVCVHGKYIGDQSSTHARCDSCETVTYSQFWSQHRASTPEVVDFYGAWRNPPRFDVQRADGVFLVHIFPMEFEEVLRAVTENSYPHWFVSNIPSASVHTWCPELFAEGADRAPTLAEAVRSRGIEVVAEPGFAEVVLTSAALHRLLRQLYTWAVSAYDIENLNIDQTANWASTSSFYWGDDPVLPRLDGVSVHVSQSENYLYIETDREALVIDIFRHLLVEMMELAQRAPTRPVTDKEVPLPDIEFATQLLGPDLRFLRSPKLPEFDGTAIRVPYSNQHWRQGFDRTDHSLPFEATGHVELDYETREWRTTP